jgi:hypothetical protein
MNFDDFNENDNVDREEALLLHHSLTNTCNNDFSITSLTVDSLWQTPYASKI